MDSQVVLNLTYYKSNSLTSNNLKSNNNETSIYSKSI